MAATGGLDGSHGILYVCGEKTSGELTVSESLLGHKVRRIDSAFDAFVAVVDAWELAWEPDSDIDTALEHDVVRDGLQHVKIAQIAAGEHHRLALTLDGEIFSWGVRDATFQHGELGQVGNGPRLWKSSSASHRVCVSPEDDEGENTNANVAVHQGSAICEPQRVHASKELFFRTIACGQSHAAAISDKGDLYTWGRNFEGQLGHVARSLPNEQNALLHGICAWPKFVSAFMSTVRVANVSCGAMFTIVLLENGAIYRFGERFTGITREPATKCDAGPQLLLQSGSDGAGFVGIACGHGHALAVTHSGELYAWGWNHFGQLGLGDATAGDARCGSTAMPTRVAAPSVAWVKVFAGGNYSAAISTDGSLFTWGVNKHGQLAHGSSKRNCERSPKRVDALQHSVVSSVVCSDHNLYAFAPTHIAAISPLCGEITGGYELRIRGSGFWASDDLTVRFAPLTDGRLARGSLGEYCDATQEVVCRVPQFSLAGDFAVEVATNGKHFTSSGHIFAAFKRPQITSVSIYESPIAGGDAATIVLEGALPRSCDQPTVRFVPCVQSAVSDANPSGLEPLPGVNAVDVVATLSSIDERIAPTGNQEMSPRTCLTHILHFVTPSFAPANALLPCRMEVSYNGGLHFVPVVVSPPAASDGAGIETLSSTQQHVVWYHSAHVQRVRPNSFVVRKLPQTITIDVDQLRLDCGGVSVVAHVECPHMAGDTVRGVASTTLKIQSISSDSTAITCVIPPLQQWEYVETSLNANAADAPPAVSSAAAPTKCSNSWWKRMPRAGFAVELQVSMNGSKSLLPGPNGRPSAELYALPAIGTLWNVFPPIGTVSGGTKLSVSGDFFHFDTPDVVVLLQWRDKLIHVPATCALQSSDTGAPHDGKSASERRVVFPTPPLPFPGDLETPTAIAEGLVLGAHEDVAVFVALDGVHYTDKSLKFVYCPTPVVLDVSPLEAEPGAKMTLRVDHLVASPHTCVRLTALATGISTVVPVETSEATASVEFELPHLPVASEDTVQVAFSVNGQQFMDSSAPTGLANDSTDSSSEHIDVVSGSVGVVSFCYKSPPALEPAQPRTE